MATGPETLRAARSALDMFAQEFQRNMREFPGVRELALYLASPDATASVPPGLLARYPHLSDSRDPRYDEVRWRAMDSAVFHMWSSSRVVYAPDPDFLAALTESTSSPIPPQVLGRVPHPNPYILLPPPHLGAAEAAGWSEIGVPVGAFVFGRRRADAPPGASPFGRRSEGQLMCSSADDRREDFGLLFTTIRQRPGGGRPLPGTMRVTLPLRGRALTIEEMVESEVDRFQFNDALPASERANLRTWLRKHIGQVACTLLYCCTSAPDMTTISRPRSPGAKGQRRPRPGEIGQLEGIGYRLGPALVEARRRAEQARGRGTGDGGRRPPHWRRGHTHTYWTGKGRNVPELKWLFPFVVSKDLLGPHEAPPAAVHPVRQPRASRHRDPAPQAPGTEPYG